jgi:methyl coenzyme M reductase alpha subunit
LAEVIESPVPNVADMELKTEDEQCASLHQFQDMLDHIKDRHSGVVTTMAEGVLELKNRLGREMIDTSVQFFLGTPLHLLPVVSCVSCRVVSLCVCVCVSC